MNMLFVLLRTVQLLQNNTVYSCDKREYAVCVIKDSCYYKIILSIHVINVNMLFVLLRTVQLLQNNTVYSCDKHEYAVCVIKDSSIITK